MKISGSEVRQGYVIEYKGKLYRVAKAQPVQLGNWRSYLQVELRELHGGTKLNERFRPDETFEKAIAGGEGLPVPLQGRRAVHLHGERDL